MKQTQRYRSPSNQRQRSRHKHKHNDKKKHHKRRQRSNSYDREREVRKNQKYKRRDMDSERYQRKEEGWKKEVVEKVQIIKELPCWEPSGVLLQFYNARQGVSLKFHEPPESRPPSDVWRVYIFKGEQSLQPIQLKNSCYLFGKDERVCDVLCQNQSISRQHAVMQFRLITKPLEDGSFSSLIKPYILDLQSTNGTHLNGQKIEPSRYIQLLSGDQIKFGMSQREYILVKDEQDKLQRQEED